MALRLACERGHQWDLNEEHGRGGDLVLCPTCGVPVAVPLAVAQAETLAPPLAKLAPPDPHAATLPPPNNQQHSETIAHGTPGPTYLAAVPPELRNHPRYRILAPLGSGGMGAVYKAEHQLMERIVALKLVNRELMENPATVERFRREVRAAARLSHPNIVTAFDAEQVGDLHFLVMEFVEGQSLANVVAEQGPLSVSKACNYVRQAAIGLQHAHEKGMVHRDIKPQNLMLTPQGEVKILDFGLARYVRELESEQAESSRLAPRDEPRQPLIERMRALSHSHTLTMAGTVMGTPDYIAPEQVNDARSADIRADVYSLGCTLYYLLSGCVPFQEGSLFDKLMAHQELKPRDLTECRPDLPASLVAIVDRMMAKRPDERYQTPGEVAAALVPFAQTSSQNLLLRKAKPGTRVTAPIVQRADTVPVVVPLDEITLARKEPQASRPWMFRSCMGCGIASVIGILLIFGAGALLVHYASDRVNKLTSMFGNTATDFMMWGMLADKWVAPPADVTVRDLFPLSIPDHPSFRRDDFLTVEESPIPALGPTFNGHTAIYQDGDKFVSVFAAPLGSRVLEDVKREAEKAFNQTSAALRTQNSFAVQNSWRYVTQLDDQATVVWVHNGWVFVVQSKHGVDVSKFMVGYLRSIDQSKPLSPPVAPPAPRPPDLKPGEEP